MPATAIAVLLTIVIFALPAATAPVDNNLIVPGAGIGKWTLRMTLDDLVRLNGPASIEHLVAGEEQNLAARRDSWLYGWASVGLGAETFDKKKVEELIAGVRGGMVPYKTDRGILLLQSTRTDIEKTYGTSTVVLKAASTGLFDLIYDKIGIAFLVWGSGEIRTISIFRPGTAKSLWRF